MKVTINEEKDSQGQGVYYTYSAEIDVRQYWNVGHFATKELAMAAFEKMKETGRI